MIQILSNILTNTECDEFITYYKKNSSKIIENQSDNLYHFNMIDILTNMHDFAFIRKLNLMKSQIDSYFKIRIQNVNNNIAMVQTPHIHTPPYNFVVFLNDDY